MKRGKQQMMEGMELPNQKKNRTLIENETYKYLGILETDNIKQVGMTENFFNKNLLQENAITTWN